MRVFRHLTDLPSALRGAVLAIGNFDGVHRGHVALIDQAAQIAAVQQAPLIVMVFEPPPQTYFRPDLPASRLTPFYDKVQRLAELGVDAVIALPFHAPLAQTPAETFVRDTLIRDLSVRAVVVGEDFRFGAKRLGSPELLDQMAEDGGYEVEVVGPIPSAEDPALKVSSSQIRTALADGRVEDANAALGRPYSVQGTVEHGDARGRTLGFPTANLTCGPYLAPAHGIYAVRVRLFEGPKVLWTRDGVANFGVRPMFGAKQPLLESFIFDFHADLYGRHIAVDFYAYLRAEAKFPSLKALIAQMERDKANARAALERIAAGC